MMDRISNPAAVDKAMTLDYTIDEAGADIKVADPDWITTKEVRVMPTSPSTPELVSRPHTTLDTSSRPIAVSLRSRSCYPCARCH